MILNHMYLKTQDYVTLCDWREAAITNSLVWR